jgi:hypothetical protein
MCCHSTDVLEVLVESAVVVGTYANSVKALARFVLLDSEANCNEIKALDVNHRLCSCRICLVFGVVPELLERGMSAIRCGAGRGVGRFPTFLVQGGVAIWEILKAVPIFRRDLTEYGVHVIETEEEFALNESTLFWV